MVVEGGNAVKTVKRWAILKDGEFDFICHRDSSQRRMVDLWGKLRVVRVEIRELKKAKRK